MATVANQDVRNAIKRNGICFWEVADKLGVNDGNFSRLLRRELLPDRKSQIYTTIKEILKERVEEAI
jgi:hypothetical protein